jgi:hypothetical protein
MKKLVKVMKGCGNLEEFFDMHRMIHIFAYLPKLIMAVKNFLAGRGKVGLHLLRIRF